MELEKKGKEISLDVRGFPVEVVERLSGRYYRDCFLLSLVMLVRRQLQGRAGVPAPSCGAYLFLHILVVRNVRVTRIINKEGILGNGISCKLHH